jgi:CRP-like cAMP-binding protein
MAPSLIALIWYYLTGNLQEMRLKPGDRIDSDTGQLYIIKRGTGQVLRDGPGGHDILLRVVRPGAVVSDGEQLMAETPLELLALPARINKRDRADG